jgi:hypothetical protein
VTAAVAVGALAAGVAFANAMNGLRETDDAGLAPSVTPSLSAFSSPTAEPSPTSTPTPTPAPTPAPTPTPMATALVPTAAPTATAIPATPAPTQPTSVAAVELPIGLEAMTITEDLRVRPTEGLGAAPYAQLLPKGTLLTLAEGPVVNSGYTWYRVVDLSIAVEAEIHEGWIAVADRDGTPWIGPTLEGCLTLVFEPTEIRVETLAELTDGMVGTWLGCSVTPWTPPYPVVVTFRGDGTYSGHALVPGAPAFYYGTDEDSPEKLYAVNDLQDSLRGIGQIDIVFESGNTNRGDLRNIELMGDQLQFEFFHRGQYGPLVYRLYRIDAST